MISIFWYGIVAQTLGDATGEHSNVGIDIDNSGAMNVGSTVGIVADTWGNADGAYSNAGIDIDN